SAAVDERLARLPDLFETRLARHGRRDKLPTARSIMHDLPMRTGLVVVPLNNGSHSILVELGRHVVDVSRENELNLDAELAIAHGHDFFSSSRCRWGNPFPLFCTFIIAEIEV